MKDPPRKGQPPIKGCSFGPLSHSISAFFNLREKDNLSTKDKVVDPFTSKDALLDPFPIALVHFNL